MNVLLGLLAHLPNGSVIDAGAHVGTETCLLAQAAPDRIVHALEPMFRNVQSITRQYVHLPNLKPMQSGLGNEEIMVQPTVGMFAAGQMFSPARLRRKKELPHAGRNENASWASSSWFPVRRVDSLFEGPWRGETLALGHFDVEGAELEVLRGATATIRRDAPVFTTELHVHDNCSFSSELLRYADALDYDSYLVEEVCGARMDCRNLVHLPRRRAGLFESLPVLGLAASVQRLFRVDKHSILEYAFPCCMPGGACCAKPRSSTCCNQEAVHAWLDQKGRSVLSGSREQPEPARPLYVTHGKK